MYVFPAVSNATSLGPQNLASVAGPPSPSCEPPSPATVVSSGFGFEASSAPSLAPPAQALAAKTTSVTTSPILRAFFTILLLLWGYICSSFFGYLPHSQLLWRGPLFKTLLVKP